MQTPGYGEQNPLCYTRTEGGPLGGLFPFAMTDDDGLQHFLSSAASHRLLAAHEEKALGRRVQAGDMTARDELVMCNIRLVVSVARYYRNRGLPNADVIQFGIIGLNRAAEKFDPERNIRFSTYATLWIKQAIQRGLTSGASAIRLPSSVAASRAKVRSALLKFPDADAEFLADLLDLEVAEVERAMAAAEVVTSLDREITTDEHTHTMLDSMADPHAPDPHDLVEDDLSDELRGAMSALPREHRRVIELHFGLTGKEPLTIEDVAKRIKRDGKVISVNTAKTLRAEAIEFLGHRLDHYA